MTTIIIIALVIALCLVSVAAVCLVAKVVLQQIQIKALTDDTELCADEIERLHQHIVELMPVDESQYFEPPKKAPVIKLFDVNNGDKND